MKVGLVLGAGGVLGGAWLTGGLEAITRHTNWDPGSADRIVGTSAGSMIGAFAAAGVPPWFMVAHSAGETFEGLTGPDGRPAAEADRSGGAVFRMHRGIPRSGPGSLRMVGQHPARPDAPHAAAAHHRLAAGGADLDRPPGGGRGRRWVDHPSFSPRGDAGQRDLELVGRLGAETDGRPGRRRGQPGAARAVHPRRGGGVPRAARARARRRPSPRRWAGRSSRCSTGPSWPSPSAAPGPSTSRLRAGLPPGPSCCTCPSCSSAATGCAPPARSPRRSAPSSGSEGAMARRRAVRAEQTSLEPLLAAKEIVICCGSGGVGKTTTAAAAAAMAAAQLGGKVLVITVDPAKRLANALGPRALRQRRDAGARRAVHGRRRRAPRRAVGGDARHQAVVGRAGRAPRPRRRHPRRDPGQPALRQHHRAGSSRATTTSPWSGCTRSTAPAATT